MWRASKLLRWSRGWSAADVAGGAERVQERDEGREGEGAEQPGLRDADAPAAREEREEVVAHVGFSVGVRGRSRVSFRLWPRRPGRPWPIAEAINPMTPAMMSRSPTLRTACTAATGMMSPSAGTRVCARAAMFLAVRVPGR